MEMGKMQRAEGGGRSDGAKGREETATIKGDSGPKEGGGGEQRSENPKAGVKKRRGATQR